MANPYIRNTSLLPADARLPAGRLAEHDDGVLIPDRIPGDGEIAKAAGRLHDTAVKATAWLEEIKRQFGDARSRLEQAQAALAAQVATSGQTGKIDAAGEAPLIAAVRQAEDAADLGICQTRFKAALDAQAQAVRRIGEYVRGNIVGLVESELVPVLQASQAKLEELRGDPVSTTVSALSEAEAAVTAAQNALLGVKGYVRRPDEFTAAVAAGATPPVDSYRRPDEVDPVESVPVVAAGAVTSSEA